mmetsp:Transcript_3494/g.6724  ORF Transcript_3494/g.6724 Transcript_3494/m.6724 type:complete len:744 (-) Transcript_3494:217-2448(-)
MLAGGEETTRRVEATTHATKELKHARNEEIRSARSAMESLQGTLMETRWSFQGRGLGYFLLFKNTTMLSRDIRWAADDALSHLQNIRAQPLVDLFRELFLARQVPASKSSYCIDKADMWKLDMWRLAQSLNEALEQSCSLLSVVCCDKKHDGWDIRLAPYISALKEKQVNLNRISKALKPLALRWTKETASAKGEAYLETKGTWVFEEDPLCELNSKVVLYVLSLQGVVGRVNAAIDAFTGPRVEWPGLSRWESVKLEWVSSLPTTRTFSLIEGPATSYIPEKRDLYTFFSALYCHEKSNLNFVWALKYTIGSFLLYLLGYIHSTSSYFNSTSLLNAVITFQVIIFKLEFGSLVERLVQRVGGTLGSYIYSGVAWELSCIGGNCGTLLHGWIFFLLQMPLLAWHLCWVWYCPQYAYFTYTIIRTNAVIILHVYRAALADPAQFSNPGYIWVNGGYVVLAALYGALLAVVLGLVILPNFAKGELRRLLSNVYHDFCMILETVVSMDYRTDDTLVAMVGKLQRAEMKVIRRLYHEACPLLKASDMESYIEGNPRSSIEYQRAVETARFHWLCIWKIQVTTRSWACLFIEDGDSNVPAKHPETARMFMQIPRMILTDFSHTSLSLASPSRKPLPVIRPLLATPFLLEDFVAKFAGNLYTDSLFMKKLWEEDDFDLLVSMIILQHVLLDIGNASSKMYSFLESQVRTSVYAQQLCEKETSLIRLFQRTPNVRSATIAHAGPAEFKQD